MDLSAFPGGDLVQEGLADLARGVESIPALLVSIGAHRLRRIGLAVPETVFPSPEHRLYEVLAATDSDSAHSRYNALVRRLVSFENTAECLQSAALRETNYLLSIPGMRKSIREGMGIPVEGCSENLDDPLPADIAK
ncbi:MAG TPA: hypothetical protein VGG20_01660 [Thermoanaerobaculia bacterium]|jgi:hypothetical protein